MNKKVIRMYSPTIIKPVTEEDLKIIIEGLDHVMDLLNHMTSGNLSHTKGSVSFLLSCYNKKIKQLSKTLEEIIRSVLSSLSMTNTGNVSHKIAQFQTALIYVKSQLEETKWDIPKKT
jgi:hypothetical protein